MHNKKATHSKERATLSNQESIWTKEFIILALINLTTFIGFNMMSTGMPVYVASLGANDLIAGLVMSLSTGAALVIRPFTGIMLDLFGRKGILISSVAAMAVTTVAYAVFPVLSIILALRLLHGIGWGLGSTATSTIAADIIPKNRFAEGMGYFSLVSSLAVAVAPALTISLLENAGVLPVIIIAASSTVLSLILTFFQSSQTIRKFKNTSKLKLTDFVDKRALLPAGIMFLISCAFASITTFIALYGQAKGVDNIFLYFTVYAIVTILSRPIIGKIIDKFGFFVPGILATVGVIATLIMITFSDNIVMFCIAGIFAGLGLGTGMGTLQTMAVAAVPSERRGVATSTFLLGSDAGMAVGATIAGAIAIEVGYANMYLVMAIFPAMGCLIFIILGKKRISSYSIQ
jgi:MFS family permease